MDPLYRRAVVQGVFGLVFFIALVFVPAGTWDYWQGWALPAVFVASTISFTIYLGINVASFAFIVLPVLDHRG